MWPSTPEPLACPGRSETWRAGYETGLAGLGDAFTGQEHFPTGIDWRGGHAVALKLLREPPEEQS